MTTGFPLLPERSPDELVRQTDWFCRHLHRDQDYFALARRLSGSVDSARQIYDLAVRKLLEDGNWHRLINPHAYMMRLIFDIAVARIDKALLPADQYISDRDVGPLPVYGGPPCEAVATLSAINQMDPAKRKILWAWRVERRSLRDIARKFHIKHEAVSDHAAKALVEFHSHLLTAFCDPARVCQKTDHFFGGGALRPVARRHRPWWRISRTDLLPLLIGMNIGIWGVTASAAITLCLPDIEGWLR